MKAKTLSQTKNIRFDLEDIQKIQQVAQQQGRTFSQQVRFMVKISLLSSIGSIAKKSGGAQ